MSDLEIIKKNIKTDKITLGKDRTQKSLINSKLTKVFVAKNLDEKSLKDLEYYSKLNDTELVLLDMDNDDLGTYCKKPFSISVIGLFK
jgi:ribosomal protein L30E